MDDRVIVGNIPSSNRGNFGYRSINTSESHNINQENILNDILDLYNKTNNIERIVKENSDFIKMENTYLESLNHILTDKYLNLIEKYNETTKGESNKKKVILPAECKVDDYIYGAIIDNVTSDITIRPSRKISKLAVFDSVTDSMYIPDTLDVDIRCQTVGVISETDNDIYAPFYNDNELYWTRKVVTDNTVEEVYTEYIITLAEEIMTTAELNEIKIHPFLCNIESVYTRYGDSNPWEKINGIEYHSSINNENNGVNEFANFPQPFCLSFTNIKANQIKIVLKSNKYIEGETNLRNFMFGIKHIGAYINYYNTYEASTFYTEVTFNETDSVILDSIDVNFNNCKSNGLFLSDIDYEFYYKDKNNMYQKIYDEFPFVIPNNKIMIKFRIGETYKEINIKSIILNYKTLKTDYDLIISHIQDMVVDYSLPFNLYYTIKATGSNEIEDITTHEISLNNGASWIQIKPEFDGIRYSYKHYALDEVCVKDFCMIRVYDFDGKIGLSNKFKISSEIFDTSPEIQHIDNITINVNQTLSLEYIAGDDKKIKKHEFSDSNGQKWITIEPTIKEQSIKNINYNIYKIEMTFDKVANKKCYIRVNDGVNDPVTSNLFEIFVKPINVTDIVIDKYSMTIPRGKTNKITQTVIPSNASDRSVIWYSDNEQVATVDNEGAVTAINPRNCNIIVTTNDGHYRATCSIKVTIPVDSVRLNYQEIELFLGESFKLTEAILPIDADNKRVIWSTSNAKATVVDGLVTAIKSGSSVITVSTEDGNFTSQCNLLCKIPVQDMELNKTNIIKKVGESEQLVAKIVPDNAYDKSISWESEDPSIASVDVNGLVMANSPGNTIIKATTRQNDISKMCNVEVLIPVNGVSLNKTELKLYTDQREQLFERVIPSNAYDKTVTWKSSNTQVATIDNEGNIVPINSGTTTITVTTNDGKFIDTCTLTVSKRITGIVLNPSKTNVVVSNNEDIYEIINVSLDGFTNNLENEEISIKSCNELICSAEKIAGYEWDTISNRDFKFKIIGKNIGESEVEVKTLDDRIVKKCNVSSSWPIDSITYIDSEEHGVSDLEEFIIPAGFDRIIRYTVSPSDCIFHLGDTGRGYSEIDTSYGTFDFSNKYEIKVSNNKIISDMYDATCNFKEFINPLKSIKVTWISKKFDISFDWSEDTKLTEMFVGEEVEIPITITLLDEFKGNLQDYSFNDILNITCPNQEEKYIENVLQENKHFKSILKITPNKVSSGDIIFKINSQYSNNTLDLKVTIKEKILE